MGWQIKFAPPARFPFPHVPAHMYIHVRMQNVATSDLIMSGGTFEGSPFVLSMSECQPAIYIFVHMFVPICELCL